jgi:hypothetical protein
MTTGNWPAERYLPPSCCARSMTVWSSMSRVIRSVISMTNSENTIRTFATLRFAGDELDPDEISRVVNEKPTRVYKKGQTYQPGPRSPEITGKTGVWYFSTKHKVPSKDLADHLNALERLISPFADQQSRLRELREIMERKNLQAHAQRCFGAARPGPNIHRFLRPRSRRCAGCRLISNRISRTKIADLSR